MSKKVSDLRDKLQDVYKMHGGLETTCARQCGCCRVACPMMSYSEAMVIMVRVWSEWDKAEILELLLTCVDHFFSRSLVKPCPLLDGDGCSVYEDRPLMCRLYGLWPKEAYDRRVEVKAAELGLPKEQIPLNVQCMFVKRVVNEPLTEEQIQSMEAAIDAIDKMVLVKAEKMSETDASVRIRKDWNYRRIEDWILFKVFGEEFLSIMTQKLLSSSDEEIRLLKEEFKAAAKEAF